MRVFIKILKILAITILVVAAVGLIFFPGKVHIERSIAINKPASATYAYVSDLKNWNSWSPWFKRDPAAKYEYINGSTGVGATLKWESENTNVGKGSMTITETKPDSIVRMDLNFMENGVAKSFYSVSTNENGSNMNWGFDVDMGANPLLRIMGYFMKGMLESDFDSGLAKLKSNLESAPESSTYKIEEIKLSAGYYLYVHDSANENNIGEHLGKDYGMIGQAMGKQRLKMAGAPFAIYYTSSDKSWAFDAGMMTDKQGKDDGVVKSAVRKEGNAVVVHYFGPYMGSSKAHAQAKDYITKNDKVGAGAPWEVYVTDPGTEKDTMKWQTDVYYPVQ